MTINKAFLFLVTIFLVSCATQLSERASRVQIISAEEAKQYQFVSRVTGTSSLTGVAQHAGYQNALNELLEKASARGADFVVLDLGSEPQYWTTSQAVGGQAYKK